MPSTWIFQANPTRFDIDAFLATRPIETEWLVSRYFNEISPGDRVFIWRSGGDKKQPAGVIADATVLTPVREVADDSSGKLWADPADGLGVHSRARISFGKIASKRGVIKRDWWKDDPVLREHLIMKMANHTTFRLEGEALDRLERLWDRTGSDWDYEDAVAGLYAFMKTRGAAVSRLPGSPVAEVALLVGRPVSGVYNAVMNYRSLDPEDGRTGLDGASDQLRYVWSQFYDENGLRESELNVEFERLWLLPEGPVDARAAREDYEEQADQLTRQLSLEELWERYLQQKAKGTKTPRVRKGATRVYSRDPVVGAIARKRANLTCEAPGCAISLFLDKEGLAYVEIHHIHTLATGGPDTPENVACLCPAHHREAHHGAQAAKLISSLKALRASDAVVDGSIA